VSCAHACAGNARVLDVDGLRVFARALGCPILFYCLTHSVDLASLQVRGGRKIFRRGAGSSKRSVKKHVPMTDASVSPAGPSAARTILF
jgi:hypothetical protein